MLTVLLVTIEAATFVVNMTFIKHGHGSTSCFLLWVHDTGKYSGFIIFVVQTNWSTI
jgi:hypothetical protein